MSEDKKGYFITEQTINNLLSVCPDSIALYFFYARKCQDQKTNQIYCTDSYARKGLSWGEVRLKKAVDTLKQFGLVERIQGRVEKGRVGKSYIKVKYLSRRDIDRDPHYPEADLSGTGYQGTNALSKAKGSALSKTKRNACEDLLDNQIEETNTFSLSEQEKQEFRDLGFLTFKRKHGNAKALLADDLCQ